MKFTIVLLLTLGLSGCATTYSSFTAIDRTWYPTGTPKHEEINKGKFVATAPPLRAKIAADQQLRIEYPGIWRAELGAVSEISGGSVSELSGLVSQLSPLIDTLRAFAPVEPE